MSRPPFTLDGYRRTVAGLLDRGYDLRSFHDVDPGQRHLVLRHDIDQSIQLARRMAEAEAEQGWRSTYFVLMRTEMYNPWSRAASEDLRTLRDLGHDIGLHLDASLYADEQELEVGAESECAALETIIAGPVTTLSFHRPKAELIGGPLRMAGRLNAYAARFVRDMGYCSDSRGEWRFGHPWDLAAVCEGLALQLLTHPVWWAAHSARDPTCALEDLRRQRDAVVVSTLIADCEPYRLMHRAKLTSSYEDSI